jgi:hypothetical protein
MSFGSGTSRPNSVPENGPGNSTSVARAREKSNSEAGSPTVMQRVISGNDKARSRRSTVADGAMLGSECINSSSETRQCALKDSGKATV